MRAKPGDQGQSRSLSPSYLPKRRWVHKPHPRPVWDGLGWVGTGLRLLFPECVSKDRALGARAGAQLGLHGVS